MGNDLGLDSNLGPRVYGMMHQPTEPWRPQNLFSQNHSLGTKPHKSFILPSWRCSILNMHQQTQFLIHKYLKRSVDTFVHTSLFSLPFFFLSLQSLLHPIPALHTSPQSGMDGSNSTLSDSGSGLSSLSESNFGQSSSEPTTHSDSTTKLWINDIEESETYLPVQSDNMDSGKTQPCSSLTAPCEMPSICLKTVHYKFIHHQHQLEWYSHQPPTNRKLDLGQRVIPEEGFQAMQACSPNHLQASVHQQGSTSKCFMGASQHKKT